jgi:hypothetical protein
LHRDSIPSHTPFSPGNLLPKTAWLSSSIHPTSLTWPPVTFLFSWMKIKLNGAILTQCR